MERKKKKEQSGRGGGGGAGRGGKGRASGSGAGGGRGGGSASGSGSTRMVMAWEDAMLDSDDDARPAASARITATTGAAAAFPARGAVAAQQKPSGGGATQKQAIVQEQTTKTKKKTKKSKSDKKQAHVGAASDVDDEEEKVKEIAKKKEKKEKKRLAKLEKQVQEQKSRDAKLSVLELKQREEKRKKKEKKKIAKLEKQAKKNADIDDDGHVDDDVAFDSEDLEDESGSGSGGDFDDLSPFEAHGFVMVDIENEIDELAVLADLADGGSTSALLHFAKSEIKESKKDKKKKKTKKKQGAAVAGEVVNAVETSEKQEKKVKQKKKKKKVAAEKQGSVTEGTGSFDVMDVDGDEGAVSSVHDPEPKKSKKEKKKKKSKAADSEDASSGNSTNTLGKIAEVKISRTDAGDSSEAAATALAEENAAAKKAAKKAKKQAKKEAKMLQESTEKSERSKERGRKAKSESAKQNWDGYSAKKEGTGTAVYEEYIDRKLVLEGLASGTFFQGRLRVNNKYRMDGYVTVDGISMDILVKGMEDRNRAFDGDLVAIQLHPESEWKPLKADNEKSKDGGEAEAPVKPLKASAPIDKTKLHSLWLPNVETTKCLIERCDEEKPSGSDDALKSEIAAIKAKIPALQLRPTAKVVHILVQGNTEGFIGSLEPKTKLKDADTPLSSDDAYAYFNANDERLPRRIQIPRLQLPDEFVSHPLTYSKLMLCFCRIKSWSTKYKRPMGEFVKTLGEFTGIESGISAILARNGLLSHTLDFDSDILDDLDAKYGVSGEKWAIPDDELQHRRDFRQCQIFSIDPYNARDLDDALHIRALDEKRTKFEIGVHIADVTHFIEPGSLLDKEAQDRATSVYLVNRVLPMLPRVLCEKLCSLQPQVDRLAFSVVWQMNADGSLVDGCEPWFGKSIIRSCCKLDYGSAQRMLDGTITSEKLELWEDDRRPIAGENPQITNASVIQSVKDLWAVGKCRRESRFDTGAISLNNVKIVFTLDATGNPATFGSYQIKDSNRLVEEYMLLANYLVAQQLLRAHGPLAFIRNHPQPIAAAMEQTLGALQENKLELDGLSTKSLSESLEEVRVKHGETAYVIAQAMIIKPMKPAEYMVAGNGDSPEDWRHYALNIPYYTHFTSPIRRYADVVVHRLLQESLTCGQTLPVDDPSRDVPGLLLALTAVSQNCNDKKTTAKTAETECDLVFLCAYVKHHGAVEVTGVVMSTGPQSFTVYIMELGLEERIFLKNADLTGAWDEKASNLAIRMRAAKTSKQGENAAAGNGNETGKPIQLSFMKKLRLQMSATEKMPLKLTFAVLGEKSS